MSEQKNKNKTTTQQVVEAIKTDPSILERQEIRSIVVQQLKVHSGPLPSPEDIAIYNTHIPNGADRIMKMAEKSLQLAENQQKYDFNVAVNNQKIQKRGQAAAVFVVFFFTALAAFIAHLGDTVSAALLMGAGLASIVASLVYSKTRKKE